MLLVLCEETDAAAWWAADALRTRGLSPTVLTGADLAGVRGWRHTVGAADAAITLRFDHARLDGRDVRAVLNRLSFVPRAWVARVASPDRDYAMQEMHAFYLSWLNALRGPMLNPPTPQGLCGNMRHPSAWAALAARAGVPIRAFRQTSEDDPAASWRFVPSPATLFVVGPRVVGPAALAGPHGPACLRLAAAAGCPLLGIDFAPDEAGTWRMTGASPLPDLARGGDALADALAAALAP